MNAAEFLRALWGPAPDGWVQTWELATKRSTFWRTPGGVVGVHGAVDLYTGVALAGAQLRRTERAKLGQIVAVPGMWLDIDAPDDQAHARARAVIEPTILVHSGHGLHAWYLLDDGPWRFRRRAEREQAATMAQQFQALHRRLLPGLDSTHDLTRLLRLPGTLNAKGEEPVPVEVIQADGPRHRLDDLRALCETAGALQAAAPVVGGDASGEGHVAALDAGRLHDAGRTLPEWVQIQLEASPELDATFRHLGHRPDWSMSEWDMSLASQAAAGLDDQRLAELIAWHRAYHDPTDPKARRVDYLARTIARARAPRMAPSQHLARTA